MTPRRRRIILGVIAIVGTSLALRLAWLVHLEFGTTIGPVARISPRVDPCAATPAEPDGIVLTIASARVESNAIYLELGYTGPRVALSLLHNFAFDSEARPGWLWALRDPNGAEVRLRPHRRWSRGSYPTPRVVSHSFDEPGDVTMSPGCAVYNMMFLVRDATRPGTYTLTLKQPAIEGLAVDLHRRGLIPAVPTITIARSEIAFDVAP